MQAKHELYPSASPGVGMVPRMLTHGVCQQARLCILHYGGVCRMVKNDVDKVAPGKTVGIHSNYINI
jgi:hypothetical protein